MKTLCTECGILHEGIVCPFCGDWHSERALTKEDIYTDFHQRNHEANQYFGLITPDGKLNPILEASYSDINLPGLI